MVKQFGKLKLKIQIPYKSAIPKQLLRSSLSSLSIFVTSVLNSASDRCLVSILFSSFFGVFFCSFIWAMFLHLFILTVSLCLFLCIRAAVSPRLGLISRCSVGSSGTASPITQAGYLRSAHGVGCVHPPVVVDT